MTTGGETVSQYFIAVAGSNDSDNQRLKAYLYSHTTIYTEYLLNGRLYWVLKTEADTESRAQFLVDYQTRRLQSGCFFASAQPRVQHCLFVLAQLADCDSTELFEIVVEKVVGIREQCWECTRNGVDVPATHEITVGPDTGIVVCAAHAEFEYGTKEIGKA